MALPMSTRDNPTPTATVGQTERSVKRASGSSSSARRRRRASDARAKALRDKQKAEAKKVAIAKENKRIAVEKAILKAEKIRVDAIKQGIVNNKKQTIFEKLKASGVKQTEAFKTSPERQQAKVEALRGGSSGQLFLAGRPDLATVKFFREGVGTPVAEGTSFVKEKITGNPFSKDTKTLIQEASGDVALFAGLSPAMQTTAQLVRTPKPVEVVFKGTQSTTKDGIVKSQAGFITSKGQKGAVEAVGQTIKQVDDASISVAIVRGKTGYTGLRFPTGKTSTKITRNFLGEQFSVSQRLPLNHATVKVDRFASITKAFNVVKGKPIPIDKGVSGGFSLIKGKDNILISRLLTQRGSQIDTIGLLSKSASVSSPTTRVVSAGAVKTTTRVLPKLTEKALMETTKLAVQTTLAPISLGPAPLIGLSSPKTRVSPIMATTPTLAPATFQGAVKLKSVTLQGAVQETTPIQTFKPTTTSINKTSLRTTPIQIPKPIVTPITKQPQSQKPRQDTTLKQISLTQQKLSRGGTTNLSILKLSETLFPSFKLPRQTSGNKRLRSFGVSVKQGKGFKNIGFFGSQSEAFGRGLDITKGSSLTTFKLTGLGSVPSAPRGYKAKKTDEGFLFIQNPKKKTKSIKKKK